MRSMFEITDFGSQCFDDGFVGRQVGIRGHTSALANGGATELDDFLDVRVVHGGLPCGIL